MPVLGWQRGEMGGRLAWHAPSSWPGQGLWTIRQQEIRGGCKREFVYTVQTLATFLIFASVDGAIAFCEREEAVHAPACVGGGVA